MHRSDKAAFVLVAIATISIVGCDGISDQSQTKNSTVAVTANQQPSKPNLHALTKEQIDSCVSRADTATIEQFSGIRLSGDMRPDWIVAGKITNLCGYDLRDVKIRITAYSKGNPGNILDTADFTIDDVPANGARGYRRDVQLMIQRGKFEWMFDEIAANYEPR